MHRLQEEQKDYQRKIEDKHRLVEDGAREDVRHYVKHCKERRRLSLAFRVKEHREFYFWGMLLGGVVDMVWDMYGRKKILLSGLILNGSAGV